ncbi:helix-turn-helix domain-containing protein [Microtetraspora malaysiensis]|uniref:Helix-turn-helix domain-containing protein n=1 Tax=Microtetraspora malaysiensis TaxID=161358 RepID=A0ABW6T398_9ACTN
MTHLSIAHNGEAIRALRKAQGLTVTQLSRRIGLTPQSLSNIELEHRSGSARTLNLIAHELGVGLGAICRDRIATDTADVAE